MATDKDILQDAMERFEESEEGSSFNRDAANEDIEFARLAKQWPDKIKELREKEGRPCLTINRLPSFIRQVVNDSRQNKPGINVGPVDDGADEDTAKVIGGLVMAIERKSNADVAYDTAIDHACSGGFGFFRIGIDFVHPMSFETEAVISRVPNPLMVHWDTNSTGFDASDWEYAFISDMLTEDEFENRYPDSDPVSFEGDPRDEAVHWMDNDKIRLAEYFERSETPGEIVMLSDGRVVKADDLGKVAREAMESIGLDPGDEKDEDIIREVSAVTGITETRRRETMFKQVKRRIINGQDILEEDDWPGESIPICPVWGEEVFLDGRRHFRSMVRDATDPQRMFNFWRSATTELVALAPKSPWVGPKGFVPEEDREKWESANTRSHAYLEYEGQLPPQRQPFAGVPAGALQEALSASDDMKAIMGIFDSSLGERSNETSGRAILARQRESDVSNFHFIDNLSRAIRYAGQVLVEIIPSVYGVRETIRILGEDRKEQVIRLSQGNQSLEGKDKLYDLSVGQYDVTVSQGPSYTTQREEAREVLIEIMRTVPEAAGIVGDLLADNLDFVGAEKLKDRLRLMLPQNIQDAENEENELPPEAQAIVMQATQQAEQLQEQLQQAMQAVETLQAQMEDKTEAINVDRDANEKAHQIKLREIELQEREVVVKERAADAKDREVDIKTAETLIDMDTKDAPKTNGQGNGQSNGQAIARIAVEGNDEVAAALQASAEAMTSVATTIAQTAAAPKKIVRDEEGRPVGVQTVTNETATNEEES